MTDDGDGVLTLADGDMAGRAKPHWDGCFVSAYRCRAANVRRGLAVNRSRGIDGCKERETQGRDNRGVVLRSNMVHSVVVVMVAMVAVRVNKGAGRWY